MKKNSSQEKAADQQKNHSEERFLVLVAMLFLTGCLRQVAASYGADGNIFQLVMAILPTFLLILLIVLKAPLKLALLFGLAAIITDLFILIF